MSWEVSSMQSKRSFFNRPLFRKNLGRFWPLWGCVSLAGAMLPLYVLLALLGDRAGGSVTPEDFTNVLYQSVTIFAPGFIAVYAILCAMAVWGYLYNSRSVGLMHTLPVDRTCLFVTNTLSGLAMVLVPFAVVGLLLCLISLFWGFFDLMAVVNTVLAVLLLAVLFFGLATLCAMLTGHVFVLPVFYALLNFLATLLEALVASLAETFLIGVGFDGPGNFVFLSPLIQIYERFHAVSERLSSNEWTSYLTGMGTVALYGLVGLALLALSWLFYRQRQSESAGDVVAFRWLRPVFRYGVALLSGLVLGRLLYELLWALLFQQGHYADLIPMCLCTAAAGIVGYYAASMLLEKSLRVFRRSWPGVAAVCAGTVLLCTLTRMDIFGAERWVPDLDEVAQVTLRDASLTFTTEDTQLIEQVIAAHQAIVADRDYIRSISDSDPTFHVGVRETRYVRLTYQMKNGQRVRRVYQLWVTAERAAAPGTFDSQLAALYSNPAAIRQQVEIPAGANIVGGYVYNSWGSSGAMSDGELTDKDAQRFYDALIQDADAGNIPGLSLLGGGVPRYVDLGAEFEYEVWDDLANASYRRYSRVDLFPTMTNTLQVLEELGVFTAAELAEMDKAMQETSGR